MNKTKADSNDTSISILKSIGSTFDGQSTNKSLHNLKDLSNRIKSVNQLHLAKHPDRGLAQEWIKKQGVNLDRVKEQARTIKDEEKKITIMQHKQEEFEEKANILNQPLQNFPFEDLTFKKTEHFAFRSIMTSSSSQTCRPNKFQKKVLFNNLRKKIGLASLSSQKLGRSDESASTKALVDQQMSKYGALIQNCAPSDLYQLFYDKFQKDEDISKKWVPLLCCQILMASNLTYQSNQDLQIPKHNYFSAVSIQFLQSTWKHLFNSNRFRTIGGYRQQQTMLEQRGGWRELYFNLREGNHLNFLDACSQKDMEVAEVFETLLQDLQGFKRSEPQINSIVVDQSNSMFEKALKLIALNTFQPLFQNCELPQLALDQPWLILMTLGLTTNQKLRKSDNDRAKQYNIAAAQFYRSVKAKLLREVTDQGVAYGMIGLLSLGKYQFLLRFFDDIRSQIQVRPIYIDWVHLMILLASNPDLLFQQTNTNEAFNVIQRCIEEIVVFLKMLKSGHLSKKRQDFGIYFNLLVRIIVNMADNYPDFPFQRLIQNACNSLLPRRQDLSLIREDTFFNLSEHFKTTQLIQHSIIRAPQLDSQVQHLQLARFCSRLQLYSLEEDILITMLIFNYYSAQKQYREPNSVFERRDSEVLREAEVWLAKNITFGRRIVVQFIQQLKELRSYVLHRKGQALKQKQTYYAHYRRNFQGILSGLMELDPQNKRGCLDIFLLYIQKLFQMYKLIHIPSYSETLLKQQLASLYKDLNLYIKEYPSLNSQLSGRILNKIRS